MWRWIMWIIYVIMNLFYDVTWSCLDVSHSRYRASAIRNDYDFILDYFHE